MTNPFDHDDDTTSQRRIGKSTNPFDSHHRVLPGDSMPPGRPSATSVESSSSSSSSSSSAAAAAAAAANDNHESSWQDLGDLPYRRVVLYSNIEWGRGGGAKSEMRGGDVATTTATTTTPPAMEQDASVDGGEERFGLSWFPRAYVDNVRAHQAAVLGKTMAGGRPNDGGIRGGGDGAGVARLLSTTTTTFQSSSSSSTTTTRLSLNRSPGDILTIGFTSRCVLVVVLRDSLTLCYDLMGNVVLPPFFALCHRSSSSSTAAAAAGGIDLLEARVFEGGVAVLGVDMNSSVVELLDEFDDPSYANGADISTRRIVASSAQSSQADRAYSDDPSIATTTDAASPSPSSSSSFLLVQPSHYALVTPLPTGMFARSKHLTFQCIAILPRQFAPSCRPELFLSTSDGSVVSQRRHHGRRLLRSRMGGTGDGDGPASAVVSMAFAPNGRFLACFTSNSILTVVSTNFESKVLEFDARSGSSSPPRSMGWCGEDSVVLHWRNLGVLIVGPYGDWLRFPYDDDAEDPSSIAGVTSSAAAEVHLVPEIDCCRVVSSSSVEILQRVPPGTADLLRIGSIEPGALLLDASDAFDSGSPSADEAARSISQNDGLLEEAIHQCVEAAVGEFDIKVQKRMLRAASYGLHFACRDVNFRNKTPGRPSPEAVMFVNAARKLRVLNALRKSGTGFAMTSSQYDSVMPKGVVARLVVSGRASLAASISEYLKLGRRVSDYAKAMKAAAYVSSSISRNVNMTDSQIAEEAIRIIRGEEKNSAQPKDHTAASPPSSGMYASVALAAHRSGRKGVADLLIMLEQSPTDKVHALIAIGYFADAAAVACRHMDAALQMAKKALRPTAVVGDNDREKNKVEMMKEASKIFDLGGKDCAFHKTCTDEQISLISDQEQLRQSYGSMEVAPPSSSLTSTIMSIIKYAAVDPRSAHRLQSDFDRIAKKYKVPEKRQWCVKVRALSESGQWAALRNFAADSRAKPPIGIRPFAQAVIKARQGQAEIMYYIDRMSDKSDGEARYELFCEAGMWKKALEEAVKLSDGRKIANVKSMCNSPDIQRLCDKYIT
ncbi:hypothetical protein ACHAXA_000878 [Cyclostephanos tholiformis]|uniref:Uncharacterized protein n=1 Tax=Cyclostephanos tholiformis TaxID=382380 RepID=A0ABD3R634_9STRA